MLKFLKNSQVRLLFSGTLFMGAFIWMAITAYDVDKQEIQVFAVFSVMLVGLTLVAGLVFAILLFLLRKGRKQDGLLGKIETIEQEAAIAAAAEHSTAGVFNKGSDKSSHKSSHKSSDISSDSNA